MQVVDDGTAPQVEEVLVGATIASTAASPAADMGQSIFNRDAFSQLRSALRCQLPLPELIEEALIGMDVDTAATALIVRRSRSGQD